MTRDDCQLALAQTFKTYTGNKGHWREAVEPFTQADVFMSIV